ncbi:MAG: Thioredoxin [Myxococcaceae bacterium]|nr:Thioredoxin [Myxococcaceae bacterium]
MASAIELTEANFEEHLKKGGTLLIDFWAAWCGPCRTFGPIFEASAAKHPELVFGKVDTEAQQSLAAAFDVRSIPTLAIFRDGILLYAEPGALPAPALENIIEQIAKLDMEKVKQDLAEQEKKQATEKPKVEA